MPVYIRTIKDEKGKIRLRAIEGQKKYNPKMNIQGPRSIRTEAGLGTIYQVSDLVKDGGFYRSIGYPTRATNIPVQYDPTITRVKKTPGRKPRKEKDININIMEFV